MAFLLKFVSGLSNIEVKRFIRKKSELISNEGGSSQAEKPCESSTCTKQTKGKLHTLLFGSILFQRASTDQTLWQQKKFGWMPHPVTQRAQFMNNCLSKCFKSFYGVKCNSPQDFAKLFHDEGRRQYDIQEQVSKITSRINTILKLKNE